MLLTSIFYNWFVQDGEIYARNYIGGNDSSGDKGDAIDNYNGSGKVDNYENNTDNNIYEDK